MAEEFSKKDLEQLENDLRELKEAYQKELEREAAERDKQATVDSSENKILAEKAVKQAEQDKVLAESNQKEKKASEDFRVSVLESLKNLDNNEENQLTNESITKLNKNLEILIEYEKQNSQKNVNMEFVGTAILTVLLLGFGIFGLVKFCGWVASKINNALFY